MLHYSIAKSLLKVIDKIEELREEFNKNDFHIIFFNENENFVIRVFKKTDEFETISDFISENYEETNEVLKEEKIKKDDYEYSFGAIVTLRPKLNEYFNFELSEEIDYMREKHDKEKYKISIEGHEFFNLEINENELNVEGGSVDLFDQLELQFQE